jgi:hypothetical protein
MKYRQSCTVPSTRITKEELQIGKLLYPETPERPKTRGQCPGYRPCPWVGCQYNNYLYIDDRGHLHTKMAVEEPWQSDPFTSCALDLTARHGMKLDEIGEAMNLCRERIRQIEEKALRKLKRRFWWLEEFMEEEPGSHDETVEPDDLTDIDVSKIIKQIRASEAHKQQAPKRWNMTVVPKRKRKAANG